MGTSFGKRQRLVCGWDISNSVDSNLNFVSSKSSVVDLEESQFLFPAESSDRGLTQCWEQGIKWISVHFILFFNMLRIVFVCFCFPYFYV